MGLGILAGELVEAALRLVESQVLDILETDGMTWGPKYVVVAVGGAALGRPMIEIYGDPVGLNEWDPAWGEYKDIDYFKGIALNKLEVSLRTGMTTNAVVSQYPHLLRARDYLYPGGVAREKDELGVGTSGAYGTTDEGISWLVYDAICTLCRDAVRVLRENGINQA